MKKREKVMRKPIGFFYLCLACHFSQMVTIPVRAQTSNSLDHFYRKPITPGVPGAELAREAKRDLCAHSYTAAIPLLEKGSQLGNSDAICYLALCYAYGLGVPVDPTRARQLMMQAVTIRAHTISLQLNRERQEERARAAREFERALTRAAENAESRSQSSTYRSNGTVPKILNPFPPPMGVPFGTTEKYRVVPWGSTVGQGE